MKNLLTTLAACLMLAFTLTGCELYFGKHDNGDDTGNPPGWTCEDNADCAAGCYCDKADGASSGTCGEAGFCDNDADCPAGYTCDDRNSCVPDEGPQTCTTDYDCAAGSYCNNGLCEASCVCENDAQAQANGYQHCDEGRKTCKPGNAGGTCGGAATCGTEPSCDAGSVPLISSAGCYTGQCSTLGNCDVQPACTAYQHESDCLSTTDANTCSAVYSGINCTGTGPGGSCTAQDSNCTCEYYIFADCR